MIKSNIHSKS